MKPIMTTSIVGAIISALIFSLKLFTEIDWGSVIILLIVTWVLLVAVMVFPKLGGEGKEKFEKREEVVKIFNNEAKRKGFHIDFAFGSVYPDEEQRIWLGELTQKIDGADREFFAIKRFEHKFAVVEMSPIDKRRAQLIKTHSANPERSDVERHIIRDNSGRIVSEIEKKISKTIEKKLDEAKIERSE